MTKCQYRCPKCHADIFSGRYGMYCSEHCGMRIGWLYGIKLDEGVVAELLYMHDHPGCRKKFIVCNINGTKYQIYPRVNKDIVSDKIYYNWYCSPIPKGV